MIRPDELIVDNFAGGGGASEGIERALGRPIDIAINHDREALAMHAANHRRTRHLLEDVWEVDIEAATEGRPVGLAWFSPDCTHHSKARGGKPRSKKIRGLAWLAVKWAERKRPRVIALENVEEFQSWCPLLDNGQPDWEREGETFRLWCARLRALSYTLDFREERAHEHGAPTIRKRLFVIARCDGRPIVWPRKTHGPGLEPYRTAADCIDWSIPCPSIFLSKDEARVIGVKRPLADATMRRIARGVKRYVIDAAKPFIVNMAHGGKVESVARPVSTIAPEKGGCRALVTPFLSNLTHHGSDRNETLDEPMRTVTGAHRGEKALIAPTLIQTGYGERAGQAPRAPGLDKPLGTVVAGGGKHALVAAFMAQNQEGYYDGPGRSADSPLSTVCQTGSHQSLVTSHIMKLRGTNVGSSTGDPLHTISAGGTHQAEVRAFLMKYYGTDQDPQLGEPLHTVTSRDRFGLVKVQGEQFCIVDIGMRMLTPRELFRAQGFGDDYVIEYGIDAETGRAVPLTKTAQVRMCGNSVCPPVAEAIVRANFSGQTREVAA